MGLKWLPQSMFPSFNKCCVCRNQENQLVKVSELSYDHVMGESFNPAALLEEEYRDSQATDVESAKPSCVENFEVENFEEQGTLQRVKAFVCDAVKGVRCTHVNLATGQRMAAMYAIDEELRNLSISVMSGITIRCDLLYLKDIYTHEECQKLHPNPMPTLTREEQRRAVLITCVGPHGTSRTLLLLPSTVDTFSENLRILHCYCLDEQEAVGLSSEVADYEL